MVRNGSGFTSGCLSSYNRLTAFNEKLMFTRKEGGKVKTDTTGSKGYSAVKGLSKVLFTNPDMYQLISKQLGYICRENSPNCLNHETVDNNVCSLNSTTCTYFTLRYHYHSMSSCVRSICYINVQCR